MTSDEVLQGAIDLLQDPERWCKKHIARSSFGMPAGDISTMGVIRSTCLVGAIRLAARPDHLFQSLPASNEAADRLRMVPEVAAFDIGHGCPIPLFNDDPNTTHEDVLLVLKKALYDTP